MAADAYTGLRKQIIAAVSERTAHLHQLAQFDSTLRAGATPDELSILVREWLGQASLEVVEDTSLDGAFEFVGPKDAPGVRVVRPAYVDGVTGRVIRSGVAERLTEGEPVAAIDAPDPTEADGPPEENRAGHTRGAVLDDADEMVKDGPRAKSSRTTIGDDQ